MKTSFLIHICILIVTNSIEGAESPPPLIPKWFADEASKCDFAVIGKIVGEKEKSLNVGKRLRFRAAMNIEEVNAILTDRKSGTAVLLLGHRDSKSNQNTLMTFEIENGSFSCFREFPIRSDFGKVTIPLVNITPIFRLKTAPPYSSDHFIAAKSEQTGSALESRSFQLVPKLQLGHAPVPKLRFATPADA